MTVSLTDKEEYVGGDLEFDFKDTKNNKKNIKICKEIWPKGSIVVFPSFVWHRVKPVTKGTRYSLVMWSIGAPFK
jgi:PKHD-type hydroxylase